MKPDRRHYLQRRFGAREWVSHNFAGCSACTLVGSWPDGEFHLDADTGSSYSDIDIYCPGFCRSGVGSLAVPHIVGEVRTSVRKYDYSETMSLDDSKLLACLLLGNGGRAETAYWNYLRAKVGLLWLRAAMFQRYAGIGSADDYCVKCAVKVKLHGGTISEEFMTYALSGIKRYKWFDPAARLYTSEGAADAEFAALADIALADVRSVPGDLVQSLIDRTRRHGH